MRFILFAIFILSFCSSVYCAPSARVFRANLVISNNPNLNGVIRGVIDVKEDAEPGAQKITFDFSTFSQNSYSSVVEIIKNQTVDNLGAGVTQNVRSLLCTTKCETETISFRPSLWRDTTNPEVNRRHSVSLPDENNCECWGTPRAHPNSALITDKVCVDKVNGLTCSAQFGDGTLYTFSNHIDVVDDFTTPGAPTCAQPSCYANLDAVFVLDISCSIDNKEYKKIAEFGIKFVDQFELVGENPANIGGVRFGVVSYGINAYEDLPLSNNRVSIKNTLENRPRRECQTRTDRGMKVGREMLLNDGRPGVPKLMIVLTDGRCYPKNIGGVTCERKEQDEADANLNNNLVTLAVGVAGADQTELDIISNNIAERSFFVNEFNQLINSPLINSLVQVACDDVVSTQNCACRGFCACDGECLCPTSCNDTNACTDDICDPFGSGACVHQTVSCSDGDPCTEDLCYPQSGCDHVAHDVPVYCNDSNPCTVDICIENQGCTHLLEGQCDPNGDCAEPTSGCQISNLCLIGSCVNGSSCAYQERECVSPDPCVIYGCDPGTGDCIPVGNVTCDANSFALCVEDYCEPGVGCRTRPVNCTINSFCEEGYCDPSIGCRARPIDCNQQLENLGGCHTVECSEVPRYGDVVIDGELVTNATLPPGCYTKLIDAIDQSQCESEDLPDGAEPSECPKIQEDKCGVCGGDGSTCFGLSTEEIAGIAAGAVAAIVIAVVIGVLAFSGGAAGFVYYKKYRGTIGEVHGNPLYEQNKNEGVNPLYDEQSHIKKSPI